MQLTKIKLSYSLLFVFNFSKRWNIMKQFKMTLLYYIKIKFVSFERKKM